MESSRQTTEVWARRQEVAARYLRGEYQTDIARSFGLSQAQISKDLAAIRSVWLQSAIRDFDAMKAQELAKIDEVERAAWAGWERSTQNKEISYSESGPKGHRSGEREERQSGNPAFLTTILTCVERRCAILGLDAPKRFKIEWDDLSDEQLYRLAKGDPVEKVLSA